MSSSGLKTTDCGQRQGADSVKKRSLQDRGWKPLPLHYLAISVYFCIIDILMWERHPAAISFRKEFQRSIWTLDEDLRLLQIRRFSLIRSAGDGTAGIHLFGGRCDKSGLYFLPHRYCIVHDISLA